MTKKSSAITARMNLAKLMILIASQLTHMIFGKKKISKGEKKISLYDCYKHKYTWRYFQEKDAKLATSPAS